MEDVYLAGRLSAEPRRRPHRRRADRRGRRRGVPECRSTRSSASGGAVGLRREGLESDIAFCAQESIVDVVGRLSEMVDGAALLTAAPTAAASDAAPNSTHNVSTYAKRSIFCFISLD